MSPQEFRDNIISTGLRLFNNYGYGSVSIRQIADELQVDRRNVSYHFDKTSLLEQISEMMWEELQELRKRKQDFPSFENLDREITLYSHLQKKYAFVFKDLNLIEHPTIHKKFKDFCKIMIKDSQQAVAFAIQQGNMHPEPIPGVYHALCEAVWSISICGLHFKTLRDAHSDLYIKKLIWSQIIPYFTEKGIETFKSYFGAEFYSSLGPPFNVKLEKVIF